MSDNDYIDVEYHDAKQEINGEESVRYTAVQVSDMLGIPVSKVTDILNNKDTSP